MNTVHTLREYVDALRDAGILVESTVSDELAAREIHCLTYDTRALSEDALFICKGAHFKEEYLCDALSRGAIAYVAEKKHNVDAPCLLVNDIRYSLVVLGQLFYNHVTDKLTSVGITGTKGKSTTAYYVRYILNDWLRAQSMPKCAILSSIDNYDGKSTEESHITTPEVLELYQHFENAYESGISHLVMEASSQALKYGRVRGITYDVAAFLNIGSDHISPSSTRTSRITSTPSSKFSTPAASAASIPTPSTRSRHRIRQGPLQPHHVWLTRKRHCLLPACGKAQRRALLHGFLAQVQR